MIDNGIRPVGVIGRCSPATDADILVGRFNAAGYAAMLAASSDQYDLSPRELSDLKLPTTFQLDLRPVVGVVAVGSRVPVAVTCVTAGSIDLTVGKVYSVIPDAVAERDGFIRVVDGSGEDYLYPAAWFAS